MLEQANSSKKRLLLISVFIAVVLLFLFATTTLLYRRARQHLDDELGARLTAVASGLARTVTIAAGDTLSYGRIGPDVLTLLYTAASENDLSNVVVLSPDGRTIVDLEGFSDEGERNPFLDLDFSAVTLAQSGIPAFTNLYKTGDVYLKSAYAPVLAMTTDEVIGIVGVEAGAAFFSDLRELSRVLIFILAASTIGVCVLGWLFYRQSVALDRAQEAIIRRENLASMGRMVANIAHDIRNPLSIIKTSAQRLRKKYNSDEEVFSYITEEVDELNRVLTGYLDFAGSHTRPPVPQPVGRIFRRCMLVVEPEIRAKGVELVQELSDDAEILVDEKRAQQAVMNVIMNAIQAVPETGGRIRIVFEKREPFGVITIEDNGCGIEGKTLKEVTKPFFTTRAEGSGLGLSIVKTVMDEHGGRLSIESTVGAGTTVSLSFPLALEHSPSPRVPHTP